MSSPSKPDKLSPDAVPPPEPPKENPGPTAVDEEEEEQDDDDPLVIDEESSNANNQHQPPSTNNSNNSNAASEDGDNVDDEEKEFEPTIDMMINDFDDERTMEEEEALEDDNAEDAAAEAEALEQEADMPLEDLLKMYGYNEKNEDDDEDEDDEEDNEEEKKGDEKRSPKTGDKRSLDDSNSNDANSDNQNKSSPSNQDPSLKRGSMSPPPPAKKSKSELARFYEATVEGRSLRSSAPGDGQDDEYDDDDGGLMEDSAEDEGRDYSWKKTIMIGPSFQASVPNDLSHYGDTLPYENEDKLLWDPTELQQEDVVDFLAKAQEALLGVTAGVANLPLGAHVRDDEQALYLLHQCGNNYAEALRRRRMNAVPPAETMSLWSEEECRAFELGLRLYGKDFHMIQQQKVRTRSVGELVQFYYLWKKTERHDVFANATRLEKKKYTLHPGTTDYMDRFIDEQDPTRDLSSSPNYHSLLYGTDTKRSHGGLSLHPSGNNSSNLNSLRKPSEVASVDNNASSYNNSNGETTLNPPSQSKATLNPAASQSNQGSSSSSEVQDSSNHVNVPT